MGKGAIILGIILIILAAILLYYKSPAIPSIVLALFGLALIIFWKAEDTIEERLDIQTKKTKKK